MTDRTGIGGNNPPPHEAMSIHIQDLFALVSDTTSGGTVSNDEQEVALDALLDELRQAKKDADTYRADEKRPHDEAGKAVQARWKPLIDRCEAGANEIKGLLTPYRTAKQAAKDEAARKAREEAEERQRAAQAALKASDDLEARFEAEEQFKVASKLTAAANRIDRQATRLRTHWEAKVTDRRAALHHYIVAKPEAFEALIQTLADQDARHEATRRQIPGITFHERKRAA